MLENAGPLRCHMAQVDHPTSSTAIWALMPLSDAVNKNLSGGSGLAVLPPASPE